MPHALWPRIKLNWSINKTQARKKKSISAILLQSRGFEWNAIKYKCIRMHSIAAANITITINDCNTKKMLYNECKKKNELKLLI